MPNRFVHTRRSGCGAVTGVASTPHLSTNRRPITTLTTTIPTSTILTTGVPTYTMVALSAGYILAAADITAAVGMSAVAFVAVEGSEGTAVAAGGVKGRGP